MVFIPAGYLGMSSGPFRFVQPVKDVIDDPTFTDRNTADQSPPVFYDPLLRTYYTPSSRPPQRP